MGGGDKCLYKRKWSDNLPGFHLLHIIGCVNRESYLNLVTGILMKQEKGENLDA